MSFWSWINEAFDIGAAATYSPAAPVIAAGKWAVHQSPSAPTAEEFSAWRDEPVTRFVMAALERNAEECREEWLRQSWETGQADPTILTGLRERADALLGFTAGYEAFCETLGLEPYEEDKVA